MSIQDCTDIKALLSGLIDDVLDPETRHEAERHLAQCRKCRQLIDEAEAVDELVEAHMASLIDPRGLPAGFEETVLSRTAFARPRSYFQQWTTWAGWLAAAAALTMAVFIWVFDRRTAVVTPAPHGPDIKYTTGTGLQSEPFRGALSADEIQTLEDDDAALFEMTREDGETLYFAAILLKMVADAESDGGLEDIQHVRQSIECEQLLDLLPDAIRRAAPGDDQTMLASAVWVLERVADEPITDASIAELSDFVLQNDLARRIDEIGQGTDQRYSL